MSKHLVGYSVEYAYEVLGIRDVQVVLADDADAEVLKWQELRSAAVKGMKRHQDRSRELTKRLNIRGNEVASLKAQLAAAMNQQAGLVEAGEVDEWFDGCQFLVTFDGETTQPMKLGVSWAEKGRVTRMVFECDAPQPQAEPADWRKVVASALSGEGVYRYGLTKGVIDRIADDLAPYMELAAARKAGMSVHVAAAVAEVERATRKFPSWPTDPLHALAVLGEEFGELTKATLQTVYEPHKVEAGELRTEAIQTAAMALRFLASLDRYEFAKSEQHTQGTNPYTGTPRDYRDVESDPAGVLIQEPGAPLRAAPVAVAAKLEHEASADCWCEPELDYVDPETGAKVWVHRDAH